MHLSLTNVNIAIFVTLDIQYLNSGLALTEFSIYSQVWAKKRKEGIAYAPASAFTNSPLKPQ